MFISFGFPAWRVNRSYRFRRADGITTCADSAGSLGINTYSAGLYPNLAPLRWNTQADTPALPICISGTRLQEAEAAEMQKVYTIAANLVEVAVFVGAAVMMIAAANFVL